MNFRYFFSFLLLSISSYLVAQDDRAQIPDVLQNAYFEVNVGYINYPFGQLQLENGYTLAGAVDVPHAAARLVLAGYNFNKYLAAQITYMRPVVWVKYRYTADGDLTGDVHSHMVWTNVGGLTLKPQLPLGEHFSVYGEGGLGIITRHGFNDAAGNAVVTNANYPTFLFGAGVKYHINDRWALQLCSNYSPASDKYKQPYTAFVGTGFSYSLKPFSAKYMERASESKTIHPKQWLQVGYSTNALGYGINNALASASLFWGGEAEVQEGISLNYQRNVFHRIKVFALDWGVNVSSWQTKGEVGNDFEKQKFFTLSVFPVLRLNYLHAKAFDAYFYYTVAAPTYISKTNLDGHDMGAHFTFMDNMGTGIFFGKERNLNAELKIGHYSNGNVFPANDAVKVPLIFNIGYAF